MAVQSSTTINASIDNVIRAFADENFARFASEKVRISFESFSVDGDPMRRFHRHHRARNPRRSHPRHGQEAPRCF